MEVNTPNASGYVGYPYYWNVLPFERDHDFAQVKLWLERNKFVSVYISAVYLLVVYSLQHYMSKRAPVDVRKPFLLWNIALAIFSFGGMCRGVPETAHVLRNFGFEYSVCENKFNSVTGFWITAFSLSKAVELLETGFVVLRKRLTWIHVVHHVIALIVTWHYVVEEPSLGRWMASMNFTVHAFMYSYFALKAAKFRIPEKVSFCLTSLQILQFITSFITGLYSAYVKVSGRSCRISIHVLLGSIVFNAYFVYIFGQYYVHRYFKAAPKSKRKST